MKFIFLIIVTLLQFAQQWSSVLAISSSYSSPYNKEETTSLMAKENEEKTILTRETTTNEK